jgi:hypothetical protein
MACFYGIAGAVCAGAEGPSIWKANNHYSRNAAVGAADKLPSQSA